MSKHTPPHRHTNGYDPACAPCNAPLTLERRSPVEKAGYLLACLARGTTSAEDFDFAAGVLAAEAILAAAPVGGVKYKPCCTWCAAVFKVHTDRAAAITEAAEHIGHARGHVVELREVIA